MIDSNIIKDLATIVGTVATVAFASILGLKKTIRVWEKDGLEIEKSRTEESLIKSLRSEIERMTQQNQKLLEQLSHLHSQINELHTSVSVLRSENDLLQKQLNKLKRDFTDSQI